MSCVHLVAADTDAPAHDDAAEADHGDLGRATTDVDDEAAGRLAHRQARPDGGRHRLLDEACPARPGVEGGIADGPLLDLGDAGRDAEDHPRPGDEAEALVHLVDEVPDHLLGDVEVADDPVPERAHGDDVGRRPADHPLRLGSDGKDPFGLRVDGDDARFAHDDAAIANVDERIRGSEVDPDIAGEHAEESVEHALGGSFVRVGGNAESGDVLLHDRAAVPRELQLRTSVAPVLRPGRSRESPCSIRAALPKLGRRYPRSRRPTLVCTDAVGRG